MKQPMLFVLFLSVIWNASGQAKPIHVPVLNNLEDFFRFEDVDQLTSCFGATNVFTEKTYFGDPNKAGKSCMISEVNFGTSYSVLVIWNAKGNIVCEVKTIAYFYDYKSKKTKLIPNYWKTYQGIHAGMNLSQLVRINWFVLKFRIYYGDLTDGTIISGFGWLKEKTNVLFSTQRLVYRYTLDMKRVKDFFPETIPSILKSSDSTVRKWNPLLGIVSVSREGLKPGD